MVMALSKKIEEKIKSQKIALVMDGYINGIGVCRSLLRDNSIIILCLTHGTSPVRFLNSRIICTDPGEDMTSCLDQINGLAEKVIVYPCSDKNLNYLILNKDKFPNFSIPFSQRDILEKSAQFDLCNKSGVLLPDTVVVAKETEMDNLASLSYPLMIKPSRAHKKLFKAEIVNDDKERDQLILRCVEQKIDAMVSEYIPGGDENLITFGGYAYKGEILSSFTGRKRSQRPHSRGVACLAESLVIEGMSEASQKFITACNYTGIFQIEYKKHAENGKFYFIEFNPRNWLWSFVATLSNRNLPVTKFYREALEETKVEKTKQLEKHFFVWIEAIFYNILKSKSFIDVKKFFGLLKDRKPYFALIPRFNLMLFITSYFNLFLFSIKIKAKKR